MFDSTEKSAAVGHSALHASPQVLSLIQRLYNPNQTRKGSCAQTIPICYT